MSQYSQGGMNKEERISEVRSSRLAHGGKGRQADHEVFVGHYEVLVDHCKDFGFYSEGDGKLWGTLNRDVT